MARVLVIGANSAIAMAVSRELAERGDTLLLAGRNTEHLDTLAEDLRIRGAAAVTTLPFVAAADTDYAAFANECWGDGLDCLLLAHGALPEQALIEDDVAATRHMFEVNGLSMISVLTAFAAHFAAQQAGQIVVISSVAGDRGRQSNYVYGSAKAAVSAYCQGLRNRLAAHGVQVLTVKPGFVDSPMTAAFDKNALWAQPEDVARGILRALQRGSDEVYLPWFWRYIMCLIRLVPERWFKRLSL